MVDVVTSVNQKLIGAINFGGIASIVSWIIGGIIIIAVCVGVYWWYYQNKIFKKRITAFEIISGYFQPAIRDRAKVVKIGTGGFEILYLRKTKTWKLAFGGRTGKNDYYFFILPDGYWYNGMLSADIMALDKSKGLIPIVTTNASMRAQYTSLEKQIDSLHQTKTGFMEKYGSWIFSITFVLIAGVLLWLMFREFSGGMSAFATVTEKLGVLVDKIVGVQASSQTPASGLTPV